MARHRSATSAGVPIAIALVLPALIAGCPAPLHDQASWLDQAQPDGACYDANLLDGLDESSTAELHAIFACLDRQGALDGLASVDAAWDTDTRDGLAGLVVARWVNGLGGDAESVSLSGLVDDALALLDDPTPLLELGHQALELAWGVPWPWLGTRVDPVDPAAFNAGLVVPILPVLGDVATVTLDRPDALHPLALALRAPELRDAAWTLAALSTSTDPALAPLAQGWADDLSNLLERTQDATNDRWSGASGDSLRDLAALLAVRQGSDGRVLLSAVADPLLPILADPVAEARLRSAIQVASASGQLTPIGGEALYLTSVDSRGGALGASGDSALVALLRLLATTNQEVTCEVPIIGVDFSLGNMAVSLLETFASLDPDTALSGVDLLSSLLGVPLTDDTLGLLQDQCPVLGDHFVDDIHAVDRLVDPPAGDLLAVLLGVLNALDATSADATDHIPALVDTITELYDAGLVPPLEEVIRDAADGPLLADILTLVPALLEPSTHYDTASFPAGIHPLSFETVWSIAAAALAPASDGVAPLDQLHPLLEPLLLDNGTWTAAHRLGALLGEPEALIRGALPKLGDALAEDPTLALADTLADTLDDPSGLRAPLVLLEGEGLRSALTVTSAEAPGVLPTLTLWVVDGTLDTVLSTLQALAALLPPSDAPPDDSATGTP